MDMGLDCKQLQTFLLQSTSLHISEEVNHIFGTSSSDRPVHMSVSKLSIESMGHIDQQLK